MDRKTRRKYRLLAWLSVQLIAAVVMVMLVSMQQAFWIVVLPLVLSLAIGHIWMYKPGGVPVLIYHSVSEKTEWLPWHNEISVNPHTFERHLATIQKLGCAVISTEEFVRRREYGINMPPRALVIHLDDGYLDNWVAAFPLLERFEMCATLFVSTDFIEDGDDTRPYMGIPKDHLETNSTIQWQGYVNWNELEIMEKSGLISVQAHGTDHARGEIDHQVINTLNENNWRSLIWKQWQTMEGSKCHWYTMSTPPMFPLGTPITTHIAALSGPILTNEGTLETQPTYENRLKTVFKRCHESIHTHMGKYPSIFCWPHNTFSEIAHELAIQSGFSSTTAGIGENRDTEDFRRIARIHVHQKAIGWHWDWADSLFLRANIRLFQGVYYWYLVVLILNTSRKIVRKISKSVER